MCVAESTAMLNLKTTDKKNCVKENSRNATLIAYLLSDTQTKTEPYTEFEIERDSIYDKVENIREIYTIC